MTDLSDDEETKEWVEAFNEAHTKAIEEFEATEGELEDDNEDASPMSAARGILRRSVRLGKRTKGSLPLENDLINTFRYTFKAKKLGYFLVFNQQTFNSSHPEGDINVRKGSDVDANRLKEAMEAIGFEVRIYDDFRTTEITEKLNKYAHNEAQEDCNAFGVALLSHGKENGDLLTFNGVLNVKDVIGEVKGSSYLAGKPKLFFFQACRGATYMKAQKVRQVARRDDRPLTWPEEADIICHFATVEGYFSYRNPIDGSWLVLNLCHQIKLWLDSGKELEFHHLLVRVNAAIGIFFNIN